jgi:acyl-CoA dehydrogenase
MSAMRAQLVASAETLFSVAVDWDAVVTAGFPMLLVPEADGGFGGDWGDFCAVMQVAGAAPLAQPLGEAMLAAWLLARAKVVAPAGLVTIGNGGGVLREGRFSGWVAAVPWGRAAAAVVATVDVGGEDPVLMLLPRGNVTAGVSPAGEPRDRIDNEDVAAVVLGTADATLFGAYLRAVQTAGALGAALELSVAHVNGRVQFGKPLAKLQAVQQALAVLAEEVAAVTMAVAAAAAALDRGGGAFEMMAAKLRANMAIHRGVAIAHQVHGAMGFTADYPLQALTRRMMGWRSDFGGDKWAELLGVVALLEGGEGFWPALTARGDG